MKTQSLVSEPEDALFWQCQMQACEVKISSCYVISQEMSAYSLSLDESGQPLYDNLPSDGFGVINRTTTGPEEEM